MKFIDIHSHFNLHEFDEDRDAAVARLRDADGGTITIGTDQTSSQLAVDLADQHDHLWATVGLHPADNTGEVFDANFYRNLARHDRVVGIGECGFDYFRIEKTAVEIQRQEKAFRAQIELAIELDLPLMLHIRASKGTYDAYDDVLAILREYKAEAREKLRGDAHFFAGTAGHMQQFIDLGFYVSFTGVITFTHDYDDLVKSAPIDRIFAETDAPYVAPTPYRGKRCEPHHVQSVITRMAQLREMPEADLQKQLLKNIETLWGIVVRRD